MNPKVAKAYAEMRALAARDRTEAEDKRLERLLAFFNWLDQTQGLSWRR